MKFTKHKITLLSIISVMIIIIGSFCSISFAKYIESRSAGQVVSRNGVPNTSIFLNPNIWTKGTSSNGEIVNPSYYMWVVTGTKTGYLVTPTRHVTPTVSEVVMDLYVFEYKYEWASANRQMIFIRANPSVSITSYTAFPDYLKWNQTNDIPYSSERNYYCIKGWSDTNYSNSSYEYNRIDKNTSTGELTWGNPSGSNITITN